LTSKETLLHRVFADCQRIFNDSLKCISLTDEETITIWNLHWLH